MRLASWKVVSPSSPFLTIANEEREASISGGGEVDDEGSKIGGEVDDKRGEREKVEKARSIVYSCGLWNDIDGRLHRERKSKRLVVWMSMSGTVEGSSLNPNAPHSVLQQLLESVETFLEHFHQCWQQEMARKDLFETAYVEALVMNLSTKSPKKGVRPGKYREKPVQCVRPKGTPRRIIHQPR
ncbi:hypothetical protein ZIOFF_034917 [Zingiber officinale]|uniref:Uncharacterized protein n=1 Tax=Zingiber officinale TaxID=94328 RepID=A0A8J5L6M9_ZINOF|nr:hypothetical protein ZIOFF_034917 [Zingiber officinale]